MSDIHKLIHLAIAALRDALESDTSVIVQQQFIQTAHDALTQAMKELAARAK